MTGTGTAPVIGVAPAPLNFGNVGVGSPSVLALTVSNTGNANLVVSNITSFTVTPGGSQIVNVTFTPAAAGAQAGTLNITHNAAGSPSAVAMTGTGLDPAIGVLPNPLDFGNVDLGTAAVLVMTVSNSGPSDLIVTNITSDDGQFVPLPTAFTVSGYSSQAVNVTFTTTVHRRHGRRA